VSAPADRITALERAVCELADCVASLAARVDMPSPPSQEAKNIVLRCVEVLREVGKSPARGDW